MLTRKFVKIKFYHLPINVCFVYSYVYVFIHIQGFIYPDLHNIFLGEKGRKKIFLVVKLENMIQSVYF